jgi:DNA polymerase family A
MDGREIVCARIVIIDSEFDAKKGQGERPGPPVCICAIEIDQNGDEIEHRLAAPYPSRPPWDRGDSFLTIGFSLSAEAGSLLHVGWPFPVPAIDLYAEYMTLHNTEMSRGNDSKEPGPSLIQACQGYGVAAISMARKEEMRTLAYTKSDHSPEEIALLQDYCLGEDCRMTLKLFRAMLPHIDLLRAPIRGAFMMEIERVRWRGPPIDMPTYRRAEQHAPAAAARLRDDLNRKLGTEIYCDGIYKRGAVLGWMRRNNIPVPLDPKTGRESCATKLIKPMIGTYPLLKEFYEVKLLIDALGKWKLEIGSDGRNRSWFNPFGTKTGRNNPSTNRALFGLPHSMRSLMKPGPGMAIAQIDYGSQEIGIAAALSRDPPLMADYLGGDPYRAFAVASLGVLNPSEEQRQVYKAIVLGRIYGMGPGTLARNAGISKTQAQRILDDMAARYPVLTAWLDRVLVKAAHCVPITCVLGWSLAATGRAGEERTFMNFPMQANAAEMMRLVFIRCAHLPLIWCVHDSFLFEAPIDRIEQVVAEVQTIMLGVSRDLLGGFELRADCSLTKDVVRYPNRFVDKRDREDGMRRWRRLMELIEAEESHGDERYAHPARGDDAAAYCCDEKEKEAETPGVQDQVTADNMANPITENEQRECNKAGDHDPVRGAPG